MGKTAQRGREQGGWLMAGLVVVVAVLVIFSGIAFQRWAHVIQRDNEAEMIFRAQDLVRAIQRYRKDHGGLGPEKLEDLKEPGPKGQYYLRQQWEDPLVRDGKWGLLYSGPGGAIIDPSTMDQGLDISGLGAGQDESRRPRDRLRNRNTPNRPGRGGQGQGGRDQQGGSTGLRIAGVKSLCEEKPFRSYRNLSEYKLWLFTYLDLEQSQQGIPGNTNNEQNLPTDVE